MSVRTLIKTATPGWFIDPAQDDKKVRANKDGDKIVDTIVSREEYDQMQKGDDMPNSPGAQALKAEVEASVVLSSGKIATGKTVEITCSKSGCAEKRTIKVQDKFQVKFCLPHQQENRNALRRQRRKAAAKS